MIDFSSQLLVISIACRGLSLQTSQASVHSSDVQSHRQSPSIGSRRYHLKFTLDRVASYCS